EIVLTANGGILGQGASYKWYTGTCGGDLVGTGSKIAVKPSAHTRYFVRAEGICNTTSCASVQISSVSVCPDRRLFNYVWVRDLQKSGYNTLPVETVVEDVRTNFSYFDGLGRISQQISREASPLKRDILSIKVYDKFGREQFSYLPVSLTGNFGMQVGNPLPLITDFYDAIGVSHPPNVAVTSHPFGESVFEPSPLNRVLEQAAPGESWRSTEAVGDYSSTDRTVKFAYETNGEAEVRLWTYTYPTTSYP